jgi:hypothetical protein
VKRKKLCPECKSLLDFEGLCQKCLDEYMREVERQQHTCPHGKAGQCYACDVASDFAYDAWREDRFR